MPQLIVLLAFYFFIFSPELYADSGTRDIIQVRTIAISPYGIRHNLTEGQGIYYDLANTLLRKSGYINTNYLYPYARIIEELKSGQTDLTIMFRYDELKDYVIYIAPLPSLKTVVIGLKGKSFPSIKALSDKKLAYLRGARFSDLIDENIEIHKHQTTNFRQGLRMLKKGRVDAIIGPIDPILSATVSENKYLPPEERIILGSPLIVDERTPWVQISKKSQHRLSVEKLRKTFSSMLLQGELERLREKYLPAALIRQES